MSNVNKTREERDRIGEEVYKGTLTVTEAAKKYGVSYQNILRYKKDYMARNGLTDKNQGLADKTKAEFKDMSKDQRIDELIKARIETERAKEGYMVKGGGAAKKFIVLGGRDSK